jgi:hypothetical protein
LTNLPPVTDSAWALLQSPWFQWTLVGAAAAGLLMLVWLWWKGRPFATGDVFRASRLSQGNRLFPTQVLISPTAVVHFTPRWIGKAEKSIHMAHVSSVKIDTGMLFSNVLVETSGGSFPIQCHGHRKREAIAIKSLIERHQTAYYRPTQPEATPNAATGDSR